MIAVYRFPNMCDILNGALTFKHDKNYGSKEFACSLCNCGRGVTGGGRVSTILNTDRP